MRRASFVSGVLALALAAGCGGGPKLTVVHGKLTDNGQSVLPDRQKTGMTIVFIPAGGGKDASTFPGNFNNENDTFEVVGRDGKGILPGTYKVTLNLMTLNSSPAINAFNQKYASGNTPIEVEVTGQGPVEIDLAKYKK